MSVKGILLGTAAVLGIAAGAVVYVAGWGKPPTIDWMVERQTLYQVLDDPETLTFLGLVDNTWLDFHSGRLTDLSPERFEESKADLRRYLEQIRSYAPETLNGQQVLTRAVMESFYGDLVAQQAFDWMTPGGLYPVNQLSGAPVSLPQFMEAQHRVIDRRSAERYVERLRAFGPKFDQLAHWVRFQAEKGVIPPDFVVARTAEQMEAFTASPAVENPLVGGLAAKLEKLTDLPAAEKDALVAAAVEAVDTAVYPGYRALARLFREELAPKATHDAGVWHQPRGEEYYALMVRSQTTTDLTPDAVHELGLKEVERITTEMDTILRGLGLTEGTAAERLTALSADPRFRYANDAAGREAALRDVRGLTEAVMKKAPDWFNLLPKQPVEVWRVPEHAEKSAPGGYYNPPALDGTRPGIFYINLGDMNRWPRWSLPTLTYHEAVPGHHFQLAWAQTIEGVPTFRRVYPFNAYAEGWALYAERLAREMGLYADDPYGDLGRLQSEIFRAARLVVDTGLHHKRWSREQAIDYMVSVTGMEPDGVRIEVERYVVDPGQALAYKVGELKILELRERARAALGDRFDIRAFHDVVLGNGGLPLTVLERVVDDWIAATRAPAVPAGAAGAAAAG
ncbi:DUF885 domain-containing protein [Rhodospirillum centenum]|uniref:DUF885 domain-containing protein n=1 Tax=Rhodospirillum centenum (strain ATCC 51521 / SW) TaxID=414684 RepID=B6IX06_RHOCS|nr:DUF885 domain-containing protein [Rhodospirillum centenum]ACJ00830.1 conserved hypothetical protein [Rhodospirillum centenum SW]